MEDHSQLDNGAPKKRPVFLTVLGILTLVNLGFAGLSALAAFATGPTSQDKIEEYIAMNMSSVNTMRDQGMSGLADAMERMVHSIQYTNDAHYLNAGLGLLIAGLGIFAVILMWRGRRLGFHLYIISCLIRIGSFYMMIPAAEVPMFLVGYFVFTSLLFIFMYSRNLKWMDR